MIWSETGFKIFLMHKVSPFVRSTMRNQRSYSSTITRTVKGLIPIQDLLITSGKGSSIRKNCFLSTIIFLKKQKKFWVSSPKPCRGHIFQNQLYLFL